MFIRVPRDQAVEAIKTGKIDVYMYGLRPVQAEELVNVPNVKLYTAPSGIVDIILNPAPVAIYNLKGVYTREEAAKLFGLPPFAISYIKSNETTGTTYVELCVKPKTVPSGAELVREAEELGINPFCFREVRFAMNYLIDRDYVINNIYRGFAMAMYIPYSPADPMYVYLVDLVAQYKFTYNPALAARIVDRVLSAVGAVKEGGKWYYNGKPITVVGVIRVEDERRIIGDMFARELERLGFTVKRFHLTFSEAIPKVYFTDPMDFQWGFYTEGWGKGAIDRWDPWLIAQFGAPWFGWMPGWGEASYWNYKNETIDKYSQPAALGEFKSKEEFINDIRNATLLALQESIRIWIATIDTIYPANAKLQGITLDLGAGLRPPYNGRSWYIPGKDTIVVGHNWVWTAASIWNPFGGFTDVYSVDPARLTYDPLVWRHPFNGEPIPFRATYEVRTAGPDGKLDVPPDAVWWDAEKDEWVPAHELGRTKATSVVVFDFSKIVGTKFHNGDTITWGDILMYMAASLEIVYDTEKSSLESSLAASSKPILDKIVAIRVLPDEKKIEVYVDYWHFDPNYIADYVTSAIGSMFLPAPIVAMMDYLAFVKKTYALSDTRAHAQNIPQLSLVEPEQLDAFEDALKELRDMYDAYKSYFTINGQTFLTKDEWEARIEHALEWMDEYENLWISDGPYKLVKLDKNAQKLLLEAFRDPTYPFGPTDWAFGIPRKTEIIKVLTPVVSPGEPAKITVEVKGEPPIHVLYLIRDPTTGEVIARGKAVKTPAGTFLIELGSDVTGKMAEYSAYELIVIAYSEKVALPAERDVTLQTGAAIAKRLSEIQQAITEQVRERMSQLQKEFEHRISQLQEQLQAQLEERLGKLGKELSGMLQQLLTTMTEQITKSFQETAQTMVQSVTKSTQTVAAGIDEVKSTVSDLDTMLKTLAKDVKNVKSKLDELSQKVSDAQATAGTAVTLSAVAALAAIAAAALAGLGLKRGGGV